MEHRIDITVEHLGSDADNADRLLGALYDLLPDRATVIDQNLQTGELSASLAIDGRDILDAVAEATRLLATAADRCGLGVPRVVAIAAREVARDVGLLAV